MNLQLFAVTDSKLRNKLAHYEEYESVKVSKGTPFLFIAGAGIVRFGSWLMKVAREKDLPATSNQHLQSIS